MLLPVFFDFVVDIDRPCAVEWAFAVVPAVNVVPVPRTELLFALPGEFCTWDSAFALAWVGPCELLRATRPWGRSRAAGLRPIIPPPLHDQAPAGRVGRASDIRRTPRLPDDLENIHP